MYIYIYMYIYMDTTNWLIYTKKCIYIYICILRRSQIFLGRSLLASNLMAEFLALGRTLPTRGSPHTSGSSSGMRSYISIYVYVSK